MNSKYYITVSALFTAIIAASAWISIPTPMGINLSFSLFGVCLAGFCLGIKGAISSTAVYIVLGAVGLPVFSQFAGGFGVLFGVSGGFLWGFLLSAYLCAKAKKITGKAIKHILILLAVIVCHIFGLVQYCIITGNGIFVSFLSVSLPFLIKDIFLVYLAQFISKKIKL